MHRVVRFLLVTAAAVAAAALAAAPAPAGQRCGDARPAGSEYVDFPLDVRAAGVSCATAMRVARRHRRFSGRNERCDLAKPSCTLMGFTCTRAFFGNSGTRVRCASDGGSVRFVYGV